MVLSVSLGAGESTRLSALGDRVPATEDSLEWPVARAHQIAVLPKQLSALLQSIQSNSSADEDLLCQPEEIQSIEVDLPGWLFPSHRERHRWLMEKEAGKPIVSV